MNYFSSMLLSSAGQKPKQVTPHVKVKLANYLEKQIVREKILAGMQGKEPMTQLKISELSGVPVSTVQVHIKEMISTGKVKTVDQVHSSRKLYVLRGE